MAALHSDHVDGFIPIAASHPWGVPPEEGDEAFARYGATFWRDDWRGFVEHFFDAFCSDPHSTKAFDDIVGWAMDTTGEIIARQSEAGPSLDLDKMDYEDVVPDNLASVMAQEIGSDIDYLDVETDGAAKAAAMIGELI